MSSETSSSPRDTAISSQRSVSSKRFSRTLGAVAAVSLAGAVAMGQAAFAVDLQTESVVLDQGHVDAFYFGQEDGKPFLALKDDTVSPPAIREPGSVQIRVKEEACTAMPEDSESVLEQLRGTDVYYLPLTQDPNLVWPGWESQPLSPHFDNVDIHVQNVEGPGDVYIWTSDAFGGVAPLLNDGKTQFPGTIHQSSLAHVHANWAFTEPGDYYFTVAGDVHNSGNGNSESVGPETYHFSVGDGGGACGDFAPGSGGGSDGTDATDATNGNTAGGQNAGGAQGGSGGNSSNNQGSSQATDGSLADTGTSAELMTGLGIGLLVTGVGAAFLLLNRNRNANSATR